MSSAYQRVGIIARQDGPEVTGPLRQLQAFLQQRGCTTTLTSVAPNHWRTLTKDTNIAGCDLLVVVGGDGTLLAAARALVSLHLPVVGVNVGRLGFLASISPTQLEEKLGDIFAGDGVYEQRMLLQAQLLSHGAADDSANAAVNNPLTLPALNDIVVHQAGHQRMIEFEIHIDGRFLNRQRGDGVIVATPTGSTAYALSAGGPLLYPTLDNILLVPINPHAMGIRPMILSADCRIEIVVLPSPGVEAQVSHDGQGQHTLSPGTPLVIERHPTDITLLHPRDYDFFELARAKLHWGH